MILMIKSHTLIKLADKLINTTNKEENLVNNIEKNENKHHEMDPFNDWVIQPIDWSINLIDVINLILDFNED